MSVTYWSSGRHFTDEHGRAIRFVDEGLATERIQEPNFPKEKSVKTEYCSPCNAYHITRPTVVSNNGTS